MAKYLEFKIEGHAIPESLKSKKNYPEDSQSIIHKLNLKRDDLANKIEKDIRKELYQVFRNPYFKLGSYLPRLIGLKNNLVSVEIHFSKGSIEILGIVTVLDWMARLSGSAALIEIIRKIIAETTDRRVSEHALNNVKEFYHADIEVQLTQENTNATRSNESKELSNKSSVFSSKNILLGITLLNLIFIFGGNILNYVNIRSIEENYKESQEAIEKSKSAYKDALMEFDASLYQLNKSLIVRENEYDSIVGTRVKLFKEKLLLDSTDISKMVSSIQMRLNNNDSIMKNITVNILDLNKKTAAQLELIKLRNEQIKKALDSDVKVSWADIWNHVELSVIPISILVMILLIFLAIFFNNIRLSRKYNHFI